MADTATLPQNILDDDEVCAYGVCINRATMRWDHRPTRSVGPDRGTFGLCAVHSEQIFAAPETDTWMLSLDGR